MPSAQAVFDSNAAITHGEREAGVRRGEHRGRRPRVRHGPVHDGYRAARSSGRRPTTLASVRTTCIGSLPVITPKRSWSGRRRPRSRVGGGDYNGDFGGGVDVTIGYFRDRARLHRQRHDQGDRRAHLRLPGGRHVGDRPFEFRPSPTAGLGAEQLRIASSPDTPRTPPRTAREPRSLEPTTRAIRWRWSWRRVPAAERRRSESMGRGS